MNSIPTTIDQVISNALFLEEIASEVTPEKIQGWEQQRNKEKSDPIDRVTRSMEKLTLALSNNFNRQDELHRGPPNRPLNNRPLVGPRPPRDPNAGPIQCWKCQGYGHKAAECTNNGVRTSNFLEAHVNDGYDSSYDYADNEPATIEERKSTLLSVITGTSQPLSSPGAG